MGDGLKIKDAEIYYKADDETSSDSDIDNSFSKMKIKDAEFESTDDEDEINGCEANWLKSRETPIEGDEEVVPKNCVIGGENYEGPIFIGRISSKGSVLPGKVIPSHKTCYTSFANKEIKLPKFELLNDKNVGWYKFSPKMKFPRDVIPIIGGYDKSNGHKLFIGKKKIGQYEICGKVDLQAKKLYIVKNKQPSAHSEFDLLVSINPKAHKILKTTAAGTATLKDKKLDPRIKPAKFNNAPIINKNFEFITLTSSDNNYIKVEAEMQNTIKSHSHGFTKYNVKTIKKIRNKTLEKDFERAVKKVEEENKGDANIKWLFHGSSCCETLARHGFDVRHSKSGGMFGEGVYFADISSKSSQYSKCATHQISSNICKSCIHSMLYCEVALGNIQQETQAKTYKTAPVGHNSVMGVASTQAGGLRYNEYIIYRPEQAIPRYLIEYNVS